MRVFPMLDFLNVFSSLPSIINPINHKRYIGNFYHYLRGNRSPAHASTFEKHEVVTRSVKVEALEGLMKLEEILTPHPTHLNPPARP